MIILMNTFMYEYGMMWEVFSQYDDSTVEMSFSPIESMNYNMNYVELSVKTFSMNMNLCQDLNMKYMGINA